MARSERAAGLIPFIIMLVLFIAAVFWGYLNYAAINNTDDGFAKQVAKLEVENKRLSEEANLYRYQLDEVGEITGFPGSGPYTREGSEYSVERGVDIDGLRGLATTLQTYQRDLKSEFDEGRYDLPASVQAMIDRTPGAGMTIHWLDFAKKPDSMTWKETLPAFRKAMQDMADAIQHFRTQLAAARSAIDASRASADEVKTAKDREISELRQRMQETSQNLEGRISDMRDTIGRLEDRVQTADEEKQSVVEAAEQAEQDYKNRILALGESLKRLKQQIAIDRRPTPDGQVLAASSTTGIAMINRGKQDNLKPGTVFQAYNFSKGNVKRLKGVLKVLDVFDDQAKCAIVQMNPGDPIVQGDLIENTLYNPDKKLHFFLLGRLHKYGHEEAKTVLTRLGNVVDDGIDELTDYVILGQKINPQDPEMTETPEYKRAQELGVKIITEKELEAFTKY